MHTIMSRAARGGKEDMAQNQETQKETMSASKAKRQRQAEERRKAKREAAVTRALLIGVPLVIIAVIAGVQAHSYYVRHNLTESSDDFSAQLNEDGTIKGVDAASVTKTVDPENIVLSKEDVEYTEEDMQSDIDSLLEQHETLENGTDLTIADGDKVSIDYIGTVDGEEFEGGSSDGNGYDLTIGSGTFVDDFEQQLIGAHPGDTLTVEVTFPDDYSTEELQGRDASFAVTVNGIYQLPVFDDAFVAENLADFDDKYENTADSYRQYLTDTHYESNLRSSIDTYIKDNTTISSYPKDYLKSVKATTKYYEEKNYAYMLQMYEAYGMANPYESFDDYIGETPVAHEKTLTKEAKEQVLRDLAYQTLYEKLGLSITEEDYTAYLEETGISEEDVETYGKGYLMQTLIQDKVREALMDKAKVE